MYFDLINGICHFTREQEQTQTNKQTKEKSIAKVVSMQTHVYPNAYRSLVKVEHEKLVWVVMPHVRTGSSKTTQSNNLVSMEVGTTHTFLAQCDRGGGGGTRHDPQSHTASSKIWY